MRPPVVEPLDPTGDDGPVSFRLRDVVLPPAHELLATVCGDRELCGQVIARSRGEGDEPCVIVKVPGLEQLVVVSAQKLLPPR